jgi:hypothetical protein
MTLLLKGDIRSCYHLSCGIMQNPFSNYVQSEDLSYLFFHYYILILLAFTLE